MAIEDAYVLAACLEKFLHHPVIAFARYEEVRRDRTAAIVRQSHEDRKQAFGPAVAGEDGVACAKSGEWQQMRVGERLDWLYAHDVTAIQI